MTAELGAVAEAVAGSNVDDEHDPEGATIAFEREQLAAARGRAARQLEEIDAALRRLDGQSYGICQQCGGRIGGERLEVLPATRTWVRCAARRPGATARR
jgi:DnaK suppressor protein